MIVVSCNADACSRAPKVSRATWQPATDFHPGCHPHRQGVKYTAQSLDKPTRSIVQSLGGATAAWHLTSS
jgi:hypothetical protein